MLEQEITGVFLTLPDPIAVEAVPGAGLLDDVLLDAEIDDFAFTRDTDAVEDLELGRLERRRDLVLDDLDARLAAMTSSPFLIEPVRRISSRTEA